LKLHFVCTGNLLRSVLCERIAVEKGPMLLGDAAEGLEVSSSGLEADPSHAAHADCEHSLEVLGLERVIESPTKTEEDIVANADLVIAMTRQQCYVLASRFPEHRRKVFSLVEANGAIETLMDGRTGSGEDKGALDRAAGALRSARRELMHPLPGVPMDIRQLMTLFGPCFYQVSGIHDPMGGTSEEVERCARLLDREMTALLTGLLALGRATP